MRLNNVWLRHLQTLSNLETPLPPKQADDFLNALLLDISERLKNACDGTSTGDLIIANRLLNPGEARRLGIFELIANDPIGAMASRRVASHAAHLYGDESILSNCWIASGEASLSQQKRFATGFPQMLSLAGLYSFIHGFRAPVSAGATFLATPSGPVIGNAEEFTEKQILFSSLDKRKRLTFSPFTRIGEFSARAYPMSAVEVDGTSLSSGYYKLLETRGWRYDFFFWGLDPLREFFIEDIDEAYCQQALGMSGVSFVVLLAALCHLIAEARMKEDRAKSIEVSSMLWLLHSDIEGEPLLRHAKGYLSSLGFSVNRIDLKQDLQQFLVLACSNDKRNIREKALSIQLGDTRYSYILHRYDYGYAVDLFHADHWLHRPLELLVSGTNGKQTATKGRRFEKKLRDYLGKINTVRVVDGLQGKTILRSNGETQDDLDCVFIRGPVLILVEAKAELLRFPAETYYRKAMEDRWNTSKRYLRKIDTTAAMLASQYKDSAFCEYLSGVKYILPLVCRPYPEWIPSLEDNLWLRKPDNDNLGVPRILTPRELYNLLSQTTDDEFIEMISHRLITVDGARDS